MSKKDIVCQICENFGDFLIFCEGECCKYFYLECLGLILFFDSKFVCMECKIGQYLCFLCKVFGKDVKCCFVGVCGKFYYEVCVCKFFIVIFELKGFCCFQYCCFVCFMEKDIYKVSKGCMMRCLRCLVVYYFGDVCIVVGSMLVFFYVFICSNYFKWSSNFFFVVNVGFCFVCVRGGRLFCCELCLVFFYLECLSIEMLEGCWNCNDCKVGKKLYYKQIVWVKLGNYRWWLVEICNFRFVLLNIQGFKYDLGDFFVFFFGFYDYYWVYQGRVFFYVEGDKSFVEGQISINKIFKKVLEEVVKCFQELKV